LWRTSRWLFRALPGSGRRPGKLCALMVKLSSANQLHQQTEAAATVETGDKKIAWLATHDSGVL
jgi:hypothetical protein